MPSEKPNQEEIKNLRKKRGIFSASPEINLYAEIHSQCCDAVDGGYTDFDRAINLLKYLNENKIIADIYPNNVLLLFLKSRCSSPDDWNGDAEHDLLNFIMAFYCSEEFCRGEVVPARNMCEAFRELNLMSVDLIDWLHSFHLSKCKDEIDLADKFVGFTGKFEMFSRVQCFSEARRRGAVPCNPAPYMDYLFVGNDFEKYSVVSSKIEDAIFYRRLYGAPLILREMDWLFAIGAC